MKNQALHPAWKDVDDADAKDAITTQSRLFRLRACDTVDFGKIARLHHMRLFGSPEWANPFRADAHGLQCARKDLTDSSRLHELVRNGGRPLEARGKVS